MQIRTPTNRNNKYTSYILLKSTSYNTKTANFFEKKTHRSQVSNGNKNRLDHEFFYQSYIERLLHLSPDDCKNELKWLKITTNRGTTRKLVSFQIFPDYAHKAKPGSYKTRGQISHPQST